MIVRQLLTAANDVCTSDAQAIFCRRRHQPRRPTPAKIKPGRPAPAMGPGTTAGVLNRTLSRPSDSGPLMNSPRIWNSVTFERIRCQVVSEICLVQFNLKSDPPMTHGVDIRSPGD